MHEFLADNIYIKAIANIGAIAAFGLFLTTAGRWLFKFVRLTLTTSVRSALYRARQKERRKALISALDIHIYVTYLMGRILLVSTSAVGMLITDAADKSAPEGSLLRRLIGLDVSTYGSLRGVGLELMGITFFLTMMIGVFQTLALLNKVSRYRLRWISRREKDGCATERGPPGRDRFGDG